MATYTKSVRNRDSLWVEARVMRDGVVCASKRYIPFIETTASLERRFKKAHKWADETIRILKEQETS